MSTPLEWLLEITDYWGKLGRKTKHDQAKLDRAKRLLERLGNPQKDFPIVHVVGTKGKGSVAAMTASITTHANLRTGLFISPHIETIEERISVDGEDIPENILNDIIIEIREKLPDLEKEEYTFFELMTAIALIYFRTRNVQLAILEAGMGGAFSATNACDPIAVVVTNISFEHADTLGPALDDIAAHKIGAIRPGVPAFTSAAPDSGLAYIREKCAEVGAPLTEITADPYMSVPANAPLHGKYQRINAALAIEVSNAILTEFGLTLDNSLIGEALSRAKLPARIEVINDNPLVIIDGAHTPESMADLSGALRNDFKFGELVLVFSMKETKLISESLRPIMPLVDSLICTRHDYAGFAECGVVEENAKKAAVPGRKLEILRVEPTIDAFQEAWGLVSPEDAIVVAGSFYLAGEARSWFKERISGKQG
ncbi:MAG: bifunctional folylpolyglutamate synthase/dihydrofolate synthase [Planctomycetota bacterium]|jgi:dihydrofolate synthase/folylpolyglutamate synthase